MSRRKVYKGHKRSGDGGRHVQLQEWFQRSEAWATLKPGPRALYVELKRRFNGGNNGEIILSHRQAGMALNVNRNTVGPWFNELESRGLIRKTRGHSLGPSGVGEAARWELEELPPVQGGEPRKTFMRWTENQNPRSRNRTLRPSEADAMPIAAAERS